jgi:hypothetical protein
MRLVSVYVPTNHVYVGECSLVAVLLARSGASVSMVSAVGHALPWVMPAVHNMHAFILWAAAKSIQLVRCQGQCPLA